MTFPTTGILDNFTAANGTDLSVYSANWAKVSTNVGKTEAEIQSNACTGISNDSLDYWTVSNFGPDCEVRCTVTTKPADGRFFALFLRMQQEGGNDTHDAYFIECDPLAGTDQIYFNVVTNGVFTPFTPDNVEIAATDLFGGEAIGTSLKMYRKAAAGSWAQVGSTQTDATFANAGKIGVNPGDTVVRLDDFGGGTVVVAATDTSRVQPMLMTLGRLSKAARPWALPTYQPSPAPYVPPVPPTISPILARFEQRFGRQPMGRVVPKESSPRNSFTFNAEVGSYALTGQSASLLATRLLNVTAGSYVLTGKAAGLLAARLLNGTAGSYTITGRAALLAAARLLNAGAGAYTYTGRNGALLRGALMPAVAGAYVINGADADLQQAGAGAFVFGAAPGVYSITGFDASLIATTVTPTPTPTPSQSPASIGGGGYGIQDRYWREREKLYERTKRKAKKRSKRAVEIVEELARREIDLSEAIVELREELAAANLKSAEIYVDLLRMKLEMVEEDDDDDDLLLLH